MQEGQPTHADIHYRLGEVSGKVESLQASVKNLAHTDEVLTCSIAANHDALAGKISGINDRVTMLFTGVLLAAFVIPIALPIAGHYIDDLFAQKPHPAARP
jgi:hypothetical protein